MLSRDNLERSCLLGRSPFAGKQLSKRSKESEDYQLELFVHIAHIVRYITNAAATHHDTTFIHYPARRNALSHATKSRRFAGLLYHLPEVPLSQGFDLAVVALARGLQGTRGTAVQVAVALEQSPGF